MTVPISATVPARPSGTRSAHLRDGVDPDAVWCQFDGGAPGEVGDAGLGCGVGGVPGGGPVSLDGRDVDDVPSQPGIDHGPGYEVRAEQDLSEVRPVDRVPSVPGGFEEGLPEGTAGVVDEDGRRSEAGDRVAEGLFDLVGLSYVDREAEPAEVGSDAGRVGVAFPDGDAGAEGCEHLGHAAADACAAAGDDGNLVVEADGVGAGWGRVGGSHRATLCDAGRGFVWGGRRR